MASRRPLKVIFGCAGRLGPASFSYPLSGVTGEEVGREAFLVTTSSYYLLGLPYDTVYSKSRPLSWQSGETFRTYSVSKDYDSF